MSDRCWHWVVAAALLCALSGSAGAGGFALTRLGGEQGHATTDHPAAIYYNPAGLSLSSGTRAYVEGLLAYHRASYERPVAAIDNVVGAGETETGTPEEAVGANSGKATLSNLLAGPFAGVVTDFGVDNLAVGLAFYAPFGGDVAWDQNDDFADAEAYPGAVDGVQRWAIIDGKLRGVYLTAAGSYTLPGQRLSVGLGVNLVMTDVAMVGARTTSGTDDMVGSNGAVVEGRALLEVEGITVGLGAGVLWQPVADLWVGASYQSQPGFGEQRLRGELTIKLGSGEATPTEIDLAQSLPDVFRVGVRYRLDRTELRLSANYTRWGLFDKQCVLAVRPGSNCALTPTGAVDTGGEAVIVNLPRNFQDTYGLELGASHQLADLVIGGSLEFDGNAVPDETMDASIMDANKIIASGGASYAFLAGRLVLNARYAHVLFFEREVEARERDADGNALAFEPPSRYPDGAGTYKRMLMLFSIGALYRF